MMDDTALTPRKSARANLPQGHPRPQRPGKLGLTAPLASLVALLLWPTLLLGQEFERWYTVDMAGQRAGYMHAKRSIDGDLITSKTRMAISVARGPVAISVTMEGRFVETAAGIPVSMMKIEQMGQMPSTTEYTFGKDEISIRTKQADQVMESTRELPEGAWLTPAAAEVFVRKRLAAGADSIVVRTLDPMSGPEPTVVKRTSLRPMTINIMGREVEVFRCSSESSAAPGVPSTEYLDATGIPVRLTMNMGGIELAMEMSDRRTAVAARDGVELAPEMMQRTFIKPDKRIRNARATTSAQYLLSVPEGTMPDLLGTGVQRIEPLGQRARVIVDLNDSRPTDESAAANPAYLESSPMLNADDPEIRKLVRRALRDVPDAGPAERSEAMRRFVYRYISSKDLDVGFASASEVARSRQGDCTEHGVLLAAMLRADGIPSRVVSGLVYADRFAGERHIFGYHMWTQALIDIDGEHHWVDLDATLNQPFDATHIALSTSALRDGEVATSLSAMLTLMGRLEIKVKSYE